MYIYIYYILFWDFGGSVSCCFNLFHQSSDSSEIRLFCGVRWLCIVSPAISASSQTSGQDSATSLSDRMGYDSMTSCHTCMAEAKF